MARTIKLIMAITGILLFLIILAIIVLPHIVDFNRHKAELEAGIYNATGYRVSLEGDIELSFLPWLGIDVGKASVAAPPEFEDEKLGSVEALQIRLQVWPLLLGQVQMDRVVLKNLDLSLLKDEQGRPNWLASKPDQARGQPTLAPGMAHAGDYNNSLDSGDFFIPDLDIAGLEVTNSSISYRDLSTDFYFRLTDLNLTAGRITQDTPFDLQAEMKYHHHDPELDADMKLTTQAMLQTEKRTIRFSQLDMDMDLQGDSLPEPIQDAKIRGDIVYAFQENALQISELFIKALEAEIQGEARALGLDATPVIRFDLQGDNIDLDRIMPGPRNMDEPGNPGNKSGSNPDSDDTREINLAFLHDFEMKGNIRLTDFQACQAFIDELEAEIASEQGELVISPVQAVLYQGTLSGWLKAADVRGEAHLEINKTLKDVQAGPLLRDLTDKDFLTGMAGLDLKLRTFGNNTDLLLDNLFGDARMEMQDGTIRGIDLDHQIRDAFAIAFGDERPPREEKKDSTQFSSFKGSFDIVSGVASSQDLELVSPVLGMRGDMRLDLPGSRVDSRARVALDGALKEEIQNRYALPDADIPLRIQGPFDDVRVGLDVEDIIRKLLQDKGEGLLQQLLDQTDPETQGDANQENGPRDMLRRLLPG